MGTKTTISQVGLDVHRKFSKVSARDSDGKELLCCVGLRSRTEPELIACPTCGRIEVDLFKLVTDVRRKVTGSDVTIAPPNPLPRPDGSMPLNVAGR